MRRTGARILIDALLREGVDTIFGIPGGVVIPIFDVLYDSEIRVVLARHEQGAGHMADGYARAGGRVGVCLATSGPGATNLVTAIATANFDSVPMVALTGQVKTRLIGNDAFQEADITGITRTVTKHNYLVRDVADLGRIIHEAFHIAGTGRPGPVLVDLPLDVTMAEWDGELSDQMNLPGYRPNYEGNPRQVRFAAEAINEARQPVLYVGGGAVISACSGELLELAHKAQIPVTTTLLALGAYPASDPLWMGMLGMHGTPTANFGIMESDLIIAVGARFDDRITGRLDCFAPNAKIIHIDIDPSSISKNIRVDIPVVGDARRILKDLLPHVAQCDRSDWTSKIAAWREEHPMSYDREGLNPQYVVEQICEATRGDAIITTEVGQNQMWAAQFYGFERPRRFLTSGGLGTMGYGMPAALGAQAAMPDAVVFDIAGDGSIQMNIQELSTAVEYKLPVNIAILNNGYLGMVRQWQELFWGKRYSSTHLAPGNPDFVKLAEAYGARGIRVTKPEDVRPALDDAIAHPGPVVLDFMVNPEENVFPMVPTGQALDKMIDTMGGIST